MARPPVTVVIPTYNRPEYLEEALRSLEQQTLLPDEVVVVDDGSDPPPQPSSTIPLRLISQANRGPAAAINRGVAEAAGDVVFLLADDDLFHPQRIEAALKAHAKFDLVVCGQTQFASQPSPDQLAIKKTGDGWAERVVADFVDKTIPSTRRSRRWPLARCVEISGCRSTRPTGRVKTWNGGYDKLAAL